MEEDRQYHVPPQESGPDYGHEYALPPQELIPEIADQIVTGTYFNNMLL